LRKIVSFFFSLSAPFFARYFQLLRRSSLRRRKHLSVWKRSEETSLFFLPPLPISFGALKIFVDPSLLFFFSFSRHTTPLLILSGSRSRALLPFPSGLFGKNKARKLPSPFSSFSVLHEALHYWHAFLQNFAPFLFSLLVKT